MLGSDLKGREFETHEKRCVVSFEQDFISAKYCTGSTNEDST